MVDDVPSDFAKLIAINPMNPATKCRKVIELMRNEPIGVVFDSTPEAAKTLSIQPCLCPVFGGKFCIAKNSSVDPVSATRVRLNSLMGCAMSHRTSICLGDVDSTLMLLCAFCHRTARLTWNCRIHRRKVSGGVTNYRARSFGQRRGFRAL